MPFPGALSGLSTAVLLDVFAAAPAALRRALDGLGEAELGARPLGGKWSIREIVAHLADSETVATARFRFTLAEPGTTLPVYDEKTWARVLGYQETPAAGLTEAVELFALLRACSARLLRAQAAEAWGRTARHPQWGEVTLRQLLELYADHGDRHLEQIAERRAHLDRPRGFEPRLTARLY